MDVKGGCHGTSLISRWTVFISAAVTPHHHKISTMLGCSPALHYSGLGEPLICPVKWIWAVTLVNLIVLCVFWKLDHPRTESWYIMPRLSVLIMCVVMFISQLHALYFPGLWQKVENFAGSLSDIITIFSFYWH